jgi:TonB family protein
MSPPKLTKFVEAVYPEEAAAQNLTARVELELVVGVDGAAHDVKVVTPVGHGFDEAAVAAASQFQFEPAQKNGQAVPARIRYPYVFEIKLAPPPEPEPQPQAPPPPARFEGQVLAAENKAPLAGAEVVVTGPDAAVQQAKTDADGRFVFDGLSAGTYYVRVQAVGRTTREQPEELHAGEATTVVYSMVEPLDSEAFGAVARIQPPPREVTRRVIGKTELTRIPGTRGDALRTVELMPGVARPPLGTGLLIVRGSAPYDTQPMFEGLPIPILYHFGGLTSFINSRMLDSIEFYPGNFSVRYGRKRGAIVEVRAADIPRDKVHGVAELNFIDASVLAEAPISKDAEFAVAARRSHIGGLLQAALPSNVSTIAAPVYYDYQTMATYRPTDRDKLRLMAFGSSDRLELLFPPTDAGSSISGFNLGTQFHRVHGSWRHRINDDIDQDVDVAGGYVNLDFGLGSAAKFNSSGNDLYGRSEWRARVSDQVRLIAGLDMFFFPGKFTYTGPSVEQSEGNPSAGDPNTFSNRDRIATHDQFVIAQPAVYLESDVTLGPWLLILGSRADYFSEVNGYSYDPRAAVHYTLTESTSLKAGAGVFSQAPQPQESSPKLGNSHLKPTHTVHLDLGAEQKVTDAIAVTVDGFYKQMFERIVGTQFGQAPYFVNDGLGRVFGAELQVRVQPRGRFFGYLAYTLSRSERKDHKGDNWAVFDFDQTHILTAAAIYRLGRGWEAGVTLRLVSGNPTTPVVGSSLNTVTGLHQPIYGLLNSERNPMFNRIDVRVEKLWTFSAWKLALYLDVQNAYNAKNPEGLVYDYEYLHHQAVRGLPILPVLGLRGEL